jgi:hypothetical protein
VTPARQFIGELLPERQKAFHVRPFHIEVRASLPGVSDP